MTELTTILRDHDLRVTTARKKVFEVLEQANEPLSIKQITTQCPDIDRVSVYRCLELFVSIDIIEIIHAGWKKRYELAGPFRSHHHHIQCVRCHAIVELHSPDLETFIGEIARSHNYTLLNHSFELRGLCPNCR